MQEPKPSGIIQFPDQHERDLRKKVADQLTKAGHPATPVDVNPAGDLSLENIKDILGKTTVHIANLPVTDEGLSTRSETAQGSKVASFIKERMRKLKAA